MVLQVHETLIPIVQPLVSPCRVFTNVFFCPKQFFKFTIKTNTGHFVLNSLECICHVITNIGTKFKNVYNTHRCFCVLSNYRMLLKAPQHGYVSSLQGKHVWLFMIHVPGPNAFDLFVKFVKSIVCSHLPVW